MIEALKLALKWAEKHGEVVFDGGGMVAVDSMTKWQNAIKEAIKELESQERNFCSRCGKRTADLTTIHTCTPPQD